MTTHVIIKDPATGEIMSVTDPAGHEGWDVLGIAEEPQENEVWDEAAEAFVLDQALVDARAEMAEVVSKERLLRALKNARQQIKDLKADMDAAKTQIQTIKNRLAAAGIP